MRDASASNCAEGVAPVPGTGSRAEPREPVLPGRAAGAAATSHIHFGRRVSGAQGCETVGGAELGTLVAGDRGCRASLSRDGRSGPAL